MPSIESPTKWGKHVDFSGFVVKSEMDEVLYYPIVTTTYEAPTECDTCVEHDGVYEIVDVPGEATTLVCQSCMVDCANSFELGNPDEYMPNVIFRVLISMTDFIYVAFNAVDRRKSVEFGSAKQVRAHYGDLPIVPIPEYLWKEITR